MARTRAWRRAQRLRIIDARLAYARDIQTLPTERFPYSNPEDERFTGTRCWVRVPGILARWNPGVCCDFCQSSTAERPVAVVRWEHELDEDGAPLLRRRIPTEG